MLLRQLNIAPRAALGFALIAVAAQDRRDEPWRSDPTRGFFPTEKFHGRTH